MNPTFLAPGEPLPPDRQKEPPCDVIDGLVQDLIEAIIEHYPEQRESIERGVNIRITTVDGVDHLFRLRAE